VYIVAPPAEVHAPGVAQAAAVAAASPAAAAAAAAAAAEQKVYAHEPTIDEKKGEVFWESRVSIEYERKTIEDGRVTFRLFRCKLDDIGFIQVKRECVTVFSLKNEKLANFMFLRDPASFARKLTRAILRRVVPQQRGRRRREGRPSDSENDEDEDEDDDDYGHRLPRVHVFEPYSQKPSFDNTASRE
jgi:hypothetical protein